MKSGNTLEQHKHVIARAKEVFKAKKRTYGDSWKTMDLHYIADRMMVKCRRITQIFAGNMPEVDEGISVELVDIINYAIIGLMRIKQEREGLEEADLLYETCVEEIRGMLKKKNHDYRDAWMEMRYASLLTQIKVKLLRILNEEEVKIFLDPSSAIDQFQDIVNYAVFALLHPQAPDDNV